MALYTKAELAKKTKAELTDLVESHGLDYDEDDTKPALIKLLLEVPEDEVEEVDEEEDLEEDVEEELDEEDDEELPEEDDVEEEVDDIEEEPVKPAKKSKAKAAKKNDDDGATLAAKQVATILGTEAKTLRQFFRSEASTTEAVGSGGRYEFLETDLPKIKEEFKAWKDAHAARGTKRGARKGSAEVAEDIEEVEELEDGIEELDDEIEEDDLELEEED